jgi:hypothetical protein
LPAVSFTTFLSLWSLFSPPRFLPLPRPIRRAFEMTLAGLGTIQNSDRHCRRRHPDPREPFRDCV